MKSNITLNTILFISSITLFSDTAIINTDASVQNDSFNIDFSDFYRTRQVSDTSYKMETLARTYRKQGHPSIRLVSQMHDGTCFYYQKLKDILDEASLVLYEGDFSQKYFDSTVLEGCPNNLEKRTHVSRVYDYTQGPFKPSEIELEPFQKAVEEQAQKADFISEEGLTELTSGNRVMPELSGKLLMAFGSHIFKHRNSEEPSESMEEYMQSLVNSQLKLLNFQGNLYNNPEKLGLNAEQTRFLTDFLLPLVNTARNKNLFEILKERISESNSEDTIDIFWGGAHMPELSIWLEEIGYKAVPEKDVWLTAYEERVRE